MAICAKFVEVFVNKWQKHPTNRQNLTTEDLPRHTIFGPYETCFSKLIASCSPNSHHCDATVGHYYLGSIRVSQADVQHALRFLHSDALGDIDRLAIKDNFNTLIESTHGLVWAASRTTQTPQCEVKHTEPRPVWRLTLACLDPTPYGFILENIESQTPSLKLVPPEPMMEEQIPSSA